MAVVPGEYGEEEGILRLLAHEALTSLELGQDAGLACALAGRSPGVTAATNPAKAEMNT